MKDTVPAPPLGIRLNNPGNLQWGDKWQGLVPRAKSMYANTGTAQQKRFCQFESPAMGIRAIAVTLITYYDNRDAADGSKIDTPREIVERWAPAFENNVSAYARQLGLALCGKCEAPESFAINMHDYGQLRTLVEAIIRHENGPGPLKNLNTWYDSATIDAALVLAGVRKPVAEAARLPVTKETVGATATGAVGIAQIADVLPQVTDAIDRSESHLSSGSMIRIVIGVATIAIAVFIAWSQLKKHQAGAL